MKKLGALILGAILTIGISAGISVKPATDVAKAAAESKVATLGKGENASDATVNGEDAIKVGTSKKGGSMTITVGEGATSLTFYAAAWNKVSSSSITLTGATATATSFALTSDSGIANNSPFTLAGKAEDYVFTTSLSNITSDTTITLTSSSKRFVVWGATYTIEVADADPDAETIEITSGLAKTEYFVNETEWDTTGLTSSVEGVEYSFSPKSPSVAGVGEKTLTITASKDGYNSGTYTQTVTINPVVLTIGEALESADGLDVSVRGIVSEINTPYSSSYNNISLTITDGENDLYIYRLTGEYEVGDDITVTGKMATYGGKRQIAQGATAVLHSSGNEIPGYVAPVEVSISEALEASDDTWVIVTGMVSNIGTAWDDSNGRISITITDGNAELYVYRLYTKVALYDYITITGKMGTYNGNRQLAEGSTAVVTNNATTVAARIKILAGGWENEVATANCYANYEKVNEMILALSAEELETFKTSTDTEIASARETYEHWCFANGATPYSKTVTAGLRLNALNDTNSVLVIVSIIALVTMLGAVTMLVLKKRKYSK